MLLFIYLVVGQILQQIRLLQKQIEWLNYSYKECKGIGIKKGYDMDEFGKFETLSIRFSKENQPQALRSSLYAIIN